MGFGQFTTAIVKYAKEVGVQSDFPQPLCSGSAVWTSRLVQSILGLSTDISAKCVYYRSILGYFGLS